VRFLLHTPQKKKKEKTSYIIITTPYAGHHYAGRGNHFWPLLYESRLVPRRLTPQVYSCIEMLIVSLMFTRFLLQEDEEVLKYGIGLTNICARTTSSSSDLSKAELRV
jgi:TDG/mug DNA glycosylase family protein